MPSDALQLLFCADRAWHGAVIEQALKDGKTVICDRYSLSTVMYGKALGLDAAWLESLNTKFIQPDQMLLLLPSFETCMQRLGERSSRDMLESDSLQRSVYEAYAGYRDAHPEVPCVDTNGRMEDVAKMIADIVLH
jgi:dTMP kinase